MRAAQLAEIAAMSSERIAVCSLFRDSTRYLDRWLQQRRAWDHDPQALTHICIEGDSRDATFETLEAYERELPNLHAYKMDLGFPRFASVVHPLRFLVFGVCGNFAFQEALKHEPDYLLYIESDLLTPPDFLPRLLAHRRDFVAPMVFFENSARFYDIWAYRRGDDPLLGGPGGTRGCFQPEPPYHPCYRPRELFEVDSAGSALLIKSEVIRRGARMTKEECVVGLCHSARALGYKVLVDPTTAIYHAEH